MPEILSTDIDQSDNPLKKGWRKLRQIDRFTKGMVVGLLLILLATPIIINNRFDTRQRASELPAAAPSMPPEPSLEPVRMLPNGKTITLPKAALKKRGGAEGNPNERGLGAIPDDPGRLPKDKEFRTNKTLEELPETVELSAVTTSSNPYPLEVNNPPIMSQGSYGTCVGWATGYYQRGYYARRDGYYPEGGTPANGSFAAIYIYSQLNPSTTNCTSGISTSSAYNLLQTQGVDTRAHYCGSDGYPRCLRSTPSADELTNASQYKISSWSYISKTENFRNNIQASLAAGDPVTISIPVYENFDFPTNCYVGVYTGTKASRGNHLVFGYAYDSEGVWIANSWGTGWGCNGHVLLSWDFLSKSAGIAYKMNPGPTLTNPTIPLACISQTSPTPTSPLPTFTPTPTLQPGPQITVNAPGCIDSPVNGTDTVTISWTQSNVANVTLRYSTGSVSYIKSVNGVVSTSAPAGFSLTIQPNTTYYASLTFSTGGSSAKTPFMVPLCGTTITPTSAPTFTPIPTATPTALPTPTTPPPTATPTPFVIPTATPTPTSDIQAPNVFITSPSNGALVQRNKALVLSAGATDNVGVTRVEFYVNNALKCTSTTSPYTCNWKVPGKANVTYTISAKAYDAANNLGIAPAVSITTR